MNNDMRMAGERGGAREAESGRPAGTRSGESAQADRPKAQQGQEKPGGPAGGGDKKAKKRRHPAVRALLWTLRASIVPLVCVAALIGGLYIGYTKLGNAPAGDVWELETWLHMFDLIFADS